MKVVKYVLGVLFILGGIGSLASGAFGGSLFMIILGALFLPPISDALKEKFKFWQNKAVRYVSYIVLFGIAGAFMPKDLPQNNKTGATKENKPVEEKESTPKQTKLNFKTCNYAGGEFYVIPDMKAADVYINFQERGFKINKNIKNEGTDIHCELSTSDVKYDVIITGCTPNKIISVEAMTTDYSGNNLEAVKSFIGFVATLQYENSKPEEARKWVEENINIDGAKTTIGGVTFSINFKSKHSKTFSMQIQETNLENESNEKIEFDAQSGKFKK